MKETYWEQFMTTGKIDDYLNYKNGATEAQRNSGAAEAQRNSGAAEAQDRSGRAPQYGAAESGAETDRREMERKKGIM